MKIEDDKQKRALLLYQAGQETQEIFETLSDTGDDYATAKTKLDDYFSPKKNVDYEIFQFRKAVQQKGETVDQFATRLRKIGANCEFHDLNTEIKSAIIQSCQSKRLRRFALRENALTLDALITKARSLEASEREATGMERDLQDESIHNVRQHGRGSTPRLPTTKCRKCGLTWPHKTAPCPAKGQSCRKCGKPNHFARMCLSKANAKQPQRPKAPNTGPRIRQVSAHEADTSSSSDDEYLYTLEHAGTSAKTPTVQIQIEGFTVDMIVDTGASVDILDEAMFNKINRSNKIQLQPPTKRLFAYGSKSQLTVVGKFDATLAFKGNRSPSTVYVLPGNNGSLLGHKTATSLNVINLHVNHVKEEMSEHERLIRQHPNIFEGIGNLKGVEVQLHIDKEVPPIAPAELLFHRKIKTKLPQLLPVAVPSEVSAQVLKNDTSAKAKMKAHADQKAKTSIIHIGDSVLVRQRKQNKLSTRYNPCPFQVIRIKGTMVTARRKDKYITRNASHFKVINSSTNHADESSDEEEEEIDEDDVQQPGPVNVQPRVGQNPNPPRRYPVRNRKSLRRFGNNVYES